jgi:ubiquinone/menaquinone biosynthesis C-methylase UbiE
VSTIPKQTPEAYEAQGKDPKYYDHNNGVVWYDAIKWLVNGQPNSFLDLGCGNNELAQRFRDDTPDVMGVDFMERQDWMYPAPYLQSDLRCPLPFDTDEYEVVTCIHVMEHLETEDQVDQLIKEMARVATRLVFVEASMVPQWFHTMIRPAAWWQKRLSIIGRQVMWAEGRDGAYVGAYVPE